MIASRIVYGWFPCGAPACLPSACGLPLGEGQAAGVSSCPAGCWRAAVLLVVRTVTGRHSADVRYAARSSAFASSASSLRGRPRGRFLGTTVPRRSSSPPQTPHGSRRASAPSRQATRILQPWQRAFAASTSAGASAKNNSGSSAHGRSRPTGTLVWLKSAAIPPWSASLSTHESITATASIEASGHCIGAIPSRFAGPRTLFVPALGLRSDEAVVIGKKESSLLLGCYSIPERPSATTKLFLRPLCCA